MVISRKGEIVIKLNKELKKTLSHKEEGIRGLIPLFMGYGI